MTLQSLERTFADKVYAICDYYLEGDIQRHSRHIYDLYMFLPKITFDDNYKKLVSEIRTQRAKMPTCPSAQPDISIPSLLDEIIEKEVYHNDYRIITEYFQKHPLSYENAIEALTTIRNSGVF